MRNARNFLLLANEHFPPIEGQRHALLIDGDRFLFSVSVGGGFWPVYLEDDDLDRDPVALVKEIKELWIEAAKKRDEEEKEAMKKEEEEKDASADADGS